MGILLIDHGPFPTPHCSNFVNWAVTPSLLGECVYKAGTGIEQVLPIEVSFVDIQSLPHRAATPQPLT